MSLLGERTAVISLGCSCQTAWQVNRNADLLSDLLDEPMARAAFPYDWLIMPPQALTSWMRSRELFPSTAAEIIAHPNFHWPRHGLYFWHEFTVDGQSALDDTFDRTREKFLHLFANLHRINALERRIFIMSNTQNNLDHIRNVTNCASFIFDEGVMRSVMDTINALVPGLNEFLFVSYKHRSAALDRKIDWPLRVLSVDESDVFGDDAQWSQLLAEVVSSPGHGTGPAYRRTAPRVRAVAN